MKSTNHVKMLKDLGAWEWNRWRAKHPDFVPNLEGAVLEWPECTDVAMCYLNLNGANLRRSKIWFLNDATLIDADLSEADLSGGYLERAILVRTNLSGANLDGCSVYGVSAWDLRLEGASQSNLIITPSELFNTTEQPRICVDDIEIAQFLYMLLENKTVRHAIDTIVSRLVVIVGSFDGREEIANGIRNAVRDQNLVPVTFDVDSPDDSASLETVSTLSHMASCVLTDLTGCDYVLPYILHIVKTVAVPMQPLVQGECAAEPKLLTELRKNHRSLLLCRDYANVSTLKTRVRRILEREVSVGPTRAWNATS